MRISTSQIFDNGILGMQNNQSDLFKIQNQLSTGRRILTPQDDAIAASEALTVTQSKEVNGQFLENQAAASSSLKYVDSQIGSVSDELQSILERSIQAGNSSYSTAQKGMIAEELKQRLANVMALANSRDSTGQYLFAGTQTQTQPFQAVGVGGTYSLTHLYVSYQGDSGQQAVQASPSQLVETSENGQNLFMQVRDGTGALTGRSIFDSIKNMIDILDPTSGVPYSAAAYSTGIDDLHATIDHVARVRAGVGSRLQALDSMTSVGEDQKLQYDQRLSTLQDVDYAAAISNLSRTQMQLQAAQLSFKQTSQLSLFNIL